MARINEFKNAVATRDFYDIAAAFRGPDNGLSALKSLFTARIRYLMITDPTNAEIFRHCELRSDPHITMFMFYSAVKEYRNCEPHHYLKHIDMALLAMININRAAKRSVCGSTVELRFLRRVLMAVESNENISAIPKGYFKRFVLY
jgi:hypothetical protein